MSWGYRVTFITIGFVCFMLFLVFSAFQQTFDLVTEDYYGKELKFQSQIEKQTNQQQVYDQISCSVSDNTLRIQFPKELSHHKITGDILFFRPSDAKMDILRSVSCTDSGVQELPLNLFSKGLYRIQMDYAAGGKKYYCEQNIMIP